MDKPKLLNIAKALVRKIQKEKDQEFQKRLVNPLKKVSNFLSYTNERFVSNPSDKYEPYINDLIKFILKKYKDTLKERRELAYILGTVARMLNFETQGLGVDDRNFKRDGNHSRRRNNGNFRR